MYDCIGFPPYYPNSQTERSSIEEKLSVFILFKKHNSDPNSDHDVTEDFMKICLLYCFYFFKMMNDMILLLKKRNNRIRNNKQNIFIKNKSF